MNTDGASAATAASNIPICGMNFFFENCDYSKLKFLIPFLDCTAPFSIGVVTDCWADVSTAPNPVTTSNRGVCLNYQQIPCNS